MPEQSVNHHLRHPEPHGQHQHAGHLTIAMAGNANVGKSSIFNQLTGLAQETGNWSGKTVGITKGTLQHHHLEIHITDLPGIYSFSTYSPEEIFTREYIFNAHPDIVINVLDATSLERNLFLTLQLKEMGVPVVIALNNSDVAEKKHINVDTALLGQIMGAPVVKTIAIKGIGVHELIDEALALKNNDAKAENTLKYGREIENRIGQILAAMDTSALKYPARWTAIQLMQGEKDFFTIENVVSPAVVALAQKLANEITAIHGEDITTVMASERYALAASIAKQVTMRPEAANRTRFKLDSIALHPVFGYFAFLISMGAILIFVSLFGGWMSSLITKLFESFKPAINSQLVDILWNGGTVGFYAALSVGIGFILPFFYILNWLSESGYFPRIAFIMDRPLHSVGLHGQASLPLVMGFGCNVPACMACRIMDNKRDRIIATFLTTMVPCSARTSVVLGLVGAFVGWYWAVGLLVFQFILIFIIGRILNKIMPSSSPGIIMEMPEYRFPSWKIVWSQTWYKFKDFLTIGVPLIVVGSMAIESLRVFGWLGHVTDFLSPVTVTWLGLPAFTGVLLIFGILRKEANLALLMSYAGAAAITSVISPLQMVVFSIVILLYIPCISTIAVLFRENGWKVTAAIVLGEIALAIFIGGIAFRVLGLWMK